MMAVSQRQQVYYYSPLIWRHFGLKSDFNYIFNDSHVFLLYAQAVLPSNGQVQGFGLMTSQPYPDMMPQMGQPHAAFPPQNDTFSQHMAGHQHPVKSIRK